MYEFLVESKSDLTKEAPLRVYDNCKEDWTKCIHGEDCLVQMCAEGTDGGCRLFKCPQAWVILSKNCFLNMFVMFCITYTRFLFQASNDPENCGFVRWVDPHPIYSHADYIYYLQNRIFDLEMEVSSGNKDEEDDNNKGVTSPRNRALIRMGGRRERKFAILPTRYLFL